MSLDTDHFRALLLDERKRVQEAIDYLHEEHPGSIQDEVEEVAGTADNHLGETATATLDREIDYTLQENSSEVLDKIEGALKRIGDGTYGVCVNCGREIPEERLEARPWSSLCIDCQRSLEQR